MGLRAQKDGSLLKPRFFPFSGEALPPPPPLPESDFVLLAEGFRRPPPPPLTGTRYVHRADRLSRRFGARRNCRKLGGLAFASDFFFTTPDCCRVFVADPFSLIRAGRRFFFCMAFPFFMGLSVALAFF